MIAFIVFFFPAVISLWILEKATGTTLTRRDWLYRFALHTVLINFVCFAVKKWILHTAEHVIFSFTADMTPSVACNYLIMALPLAVGFALLPVVLCWLRPYVRFRIEDVNEPAGGNE